MKKLLDKIKGQKILVIGDVGLDIYNIGESNRLSQEAPVPVVELKTIERRLGMAANVANNIAKLGGTPHLMSVRGDDNYALDLDKKLRQAGISFCLIEEEGRITTTKTRVISGANHIVRIDKEDKHDIHDSSRALLLEEIHYIIKEYNGIILQDYAKGLFDYKFLQKIIDLANLNNIPIFVDPHKSRSYFDYFGATLMTPNLEEAVSLKAVEGWTESGYKNHLIVTKGKEGMDLYTNGDVTNFKAEQAEAFDVTGAGDTVISVIAMAYSAGISLEDACELANKAAGAVVRKQGTATVTPEEIIKAC